MRMIDVGVLTASLALVAVAGILVGCEPMQLSWQPYPYKPVEMPYLELGSYRSRPGVRDVVRPTPSPTNASANDRTSIAVSGNRSWRYVVIHHSASEGGNAQTFDKIHREKNGWDELGYHFVIDNGDGGPDGRVEIGPRWRKQKHGAHCGKTPNNEYNEYGIGICLVGNFMTHMPSPAQMRSLQELVGDLMAKYNIPPSRVISHRDAPNAKTACCGDMLHQNLHGPFRRTLQQDIYAAGTR